MNCTPFFSGDIKPVRDGIYQRTARWWSCNVYFARFEGGTWYISSATAAEAADKSIASSYQSHFGVKWRGLARKP